MTQKQLAEREYPIIYPLDFNQDERSAFINGLEHAVEFLKHMHPGAHDEWYYENFEIFLTEKYGSNEHEK